MCLITHTYANISGLFVQKKNLKSGTAVTSVTEKNTFSAVIALVKTFTFYFQVGLGISRTNADSQ